MLECPDCKSNSIQSKGYRTKGVHRYICNKCGRNFTQHIYPESEKIKEELMSDNIKPKMITIAVSEDIHSWLTGLKLIPQEPLTNVLKRLKEAKI